VPVPPCESPFADRGVIVLATTRSGSTWLVELLGAHPAVGTTKGESTIFHALNDLWLNLHDPHGGLAGYMDRREVIAAMRQFCDGVFGSAIARQAPGATWFVEKTPGQANRIPLMAATHPDAWFIRLIRDGRDVVRSVIRTPWGNKEPGPAAGDWSRGVSDALQDSWRLERVREVRYEDLVVDPVGVVSELFEWMGLDVDADVERELKERAAIEVSRFAATDPVGAGKWIDLPTEVLDEIYEVAGDLLVQLGYITDPVTPSQSPESA
jgi:LPS sulfotransferase NodH